MKNAATVVKLQLWSAARSLWRNPSVALAICAVLSMGIGSVSAIFSVVEKVLLEPLPYPEPDRLVQLVTTSFHIGDESLASVPKYLIWRDCSRPFESIAARDVHVPQMNLFEDQGRKALQVARVSSEYFRVFGIRFTVGSTFSAVDDSPTGRNVAIISHELWRRSFHADSNLVGRSIVLDDVPYKVVGVLSPDAHLERASDVWLPLRSDQTSTDLVGRLQVVARLRAGISIEQAQRELLEQTRNSASASVRTNYGDVFATGDSKLISLRDALVGDVRPSLYILLGAAGFALGICCLNSATLFLARSTQRTRELAIRMAMGAPRSRLLFELLTESLLLSLFSGMTGLLTGYVAVREILTISPAELGRVGANGSPITLNGTVFAFTLFVSVIVGIVSALAPALSASRENFGVLLKQGISESGMALRRGQRRSILIVVQVSLSLVLLLGAGLLMRTFVSKRAINRGFSEDNVVTISMSFDNQRFAATAEVEQLVRLAGRRMHDIPGVVAVATTSALPVSASLSMPFKVFEYNTSSGRYDGTATWRSVSSEYFKVFQIALMRGRLFTDEDNERSASVVLINRAMAKRYWRGIDANPVGDFLSIGYAAGPGQTDPPRQIVGIVADVRDAGLDREPSIYVPLAQLPNWINARNNLLQPTIWVIRADRVDHNRVSLIPQILQQLSSVSAGQPIGPAITMREAIAASSARIRFYITALIVFSGIALALTGMGIYSLLSYSVRLRRKELAIRSALGADSFEVKAMVMKQALRLTAVGTLAGIPLAVVLAQVTISLVFDVTPWDPQVLALVAFLLCVVSVVAAYAPAVRAGQCDPATALRGDS
jgi:putative ABC transport system permease protein